MSSSPNNDEIEEGLHSRPNKSQLKRDSQHLLDIGEQILKLKQEELQALDLPAALEEAVSTALRIKSRSGLKRQRQYIGKLLRSMDSEHIEIQLRKIQHRHDTNTAQFKRLERWRDMLIDNDKTTLDEVISHFPDIDRQHINQLIRTAHQEKKRDKAPTSARKLFKYLSELESSE
jgi:ribosome-associated protein